LGLEGLVRRVWLRVLVWLKWLVGLRGGGAFVGDDEGGAAGVVTAQGGQDLGGRVQAGYRHRLGGGTQGRGDGHLVPLGHPQPRGERADHAAEPGRVRD
jgi:hypothetical protein